MHEFAGAGAPPPAVTRISAAADGSVWALDDAGALLTTTDDEVAWQARPFPAPGRLVSVGAGSDGAVFGTAEDGLVYTYTDTWKPAAQPGVHLASVSVGGASSVWGVDAKGGLQTFDASADAWKPVAPPADSSAARVATAADGSVFCLTTQGAAYTLSGTMWQPLASGAALVDIAAGAAGWVWSVSSDGALAQYDGQAWQPVGTPGGEAVAHVACGADLTVWVIDAAGRLYQFDAKNDAWLPIAAPAALGALALGSVQAAWALGTDGSAYQYTEAADIWIASGTPGSFTQLAAVDNSTVWTIDAHGAVQRLSRSGQNWSVKAEPAGPVWIAAGQDGSIWGASKDGAVLGLDQVHGEWQPLPAPPAPAVRVSAGDAASVTALDAAGAVHRYDSAAKSWTTLDQQAPAGGFTDISTLPGGATFAVAAGTVQLYIGEWVPTGTPAVAVAAASPTDAWAIDLSGHPAHFLRSAAESTQSSRPDLPGWDAEDVFDETRSTHLYIVNHAIRLCAAQGGPVGAWLAAKLQPGAGRLPDNPLHNQMCQGLYDADFVNPYNDPMLIFFPTYQSHFYDPRTGENWLGKTSPTALTQGTEYFNDSVAAYRDGRIDGSHGAGYRLGLALHYMTDATQPMHSSNFTNLSSGPIVGFHSAYESLVLAYQSAPRFQPTPFPIPRFGGDPGEYIVAAAKHSRPNVIRILPPDVFTNYHGYLSAEDLARIERSAPDLIGYAIAATAGLLFAWGNLLYTRPKDWEDMGQPAPDVTAVAGIGATMTADGRPYLFAKGSDGGLWVRWDYGANNWRWTNQQLPGGRAIASGIGAGNSSYGPAAFLLDEAGGVLANWWTGSEWEWNDLGTPPSTGPAPARITGAAVAALPEVDAAVFVVTDQGTLFKNQVPTSQWEQVQLPPGLTVSSLLGATIANRGPGQDRRSVLAIMSDQDLWLWEEDAYANGTWSVIGQPPGTAIAASLGVASLQGFALGADGQVWFCQWDTGYGSWTSFGQPPDDLDVVSGLTLNPARYPYYVPLVMGLAAKGPVVLGQQFVEDDSPVVLWEDRGTPGETSIASTVGFLPYQGDYLTAVIGADGHLWA